MAERMAGVECGAQLSPERQECDNRKYREERSKEHDLAGRNVASRLDAGRHAHEDRDGGNLQPNSNEGIRGWMVRGYQFLSAAWIADQMRAGVAGISMWPIP